MSNTIPTLITREVVNPNVCDVSDGCTRVRFPDGSGQVINNLHKEDPERLRKLLTGWLSAHIDAIRKEDRDE